jgi:hypothetical protein
MLSPPPIGGLCRSWIAWSDTQIDSAGSNCLYGTTSFLQYCILRDNWASQSMEQNIRTGPTWSCRGRSLSSRDGQTSEKWCFEERIRRTVTRSTEPAWSSTTFHWSARLAMIANDLYTTRETGRPVKSGA